MPDREALSDRSTRALVSLAIGPCGCGYGIECENGETGQATVARWKSEGATVERVPIEEAQERCVLDCPHEPRYGLLPLSEARAEANRLRAENEALKRAPYYRSCVCVALHEENERLREALAESERHRIRPAGPDRVKLPSPDAFDEPQAPTPRYEIVKMLSGMWNVREANSKEWHTPGVGLSKVAAQTMADDLNSSLPTAGETP